MPIQDPPYIPAAPEPPDRSDRVNFNTRARAWAEYQKVELVPGVNDALDNVYSNALHAQSMAQEAADSRDDADASARAAANSAEAAASLSGSTVWDPAGFYATGAAVWVPGTGVIFRRLAPGGTSATPPPDDPANWEQIGSAANSSGNPIGGPSSTAYTYDAQLRVTRMDSMQDGYELVTLMEYYPSGAIYRVTTTYRGKSRVDEFSWNGVLLTSVTRIS